MGTESFPGVRRPRRGADHPPPPSAEVKRMWSYTSTRSLGFRVCYGVPLHIPYQCIDWFVNFPSVFTHFSQPCFDVELTRLSEVLIVFSVSSKFSLRISPRLSAFLSSKFHVLFSSLPLSKSSFLVSGLLNVSQHLGLICFLTLRLVF
jgi:hypothetical protein